MLTERIIIQEYLSVQNDNGFEKMQWNDYYKCWSAFRTISGKEYVSAKATQSENVVTFTVRFCRKTSELLKNGATKRFRVVFKGNIYDIEYCNDYENLHNFIDIKARNL